MPAEKQLNTTALAFLGDAVYEVYVRKHVIEMGGAHADAMHKAAVRYVSAEGQEKIIKELMETVLTEEETALVKRARNHRATSSKKTKASHRGSDIMTDKLATAFEALIGWLYINGNDDRLKELIERSFEIIES